MKTILLAFKDKRASSQSKPTRYQVTSESQDGNTLSIFHTHVFSDKSRSTNEYTIVKQADGSWKSNTSCEYVQVKADRRPKPFSVESQEEGRGPKTIRKFATTEELKEYVMGRWQGWDYWDGGNCFHGDYATFVVKGAELKDLVPAREIFDLFPTLPREAQKITGRRSHEGSLEELIGTAEYRALREEFSAAGGTARWRKITPRQLKQPVQQPRRKLKLLNSCSGDSGVGYWEAASIEDDNDH